MYPIKQAHSSYRHTGKQGSAEKTGVELAIPIYGDCHSDTAIHTYSIKQLIVFGLQKSLVPVL